MAFELTVACARNIPEDLGAQWPASLNKHGIQCEVYPSFTPDSWNGGFLPFKIHAMPHHLIDADLRAPARSGFEVNFVENTAFFRSARGRTCTEFSLLCLCAAELTVMTAGTWHDPQTDNSFDANHVLQAAFEEIKETLAFPGIADRSQVPFTGWD